MKGEQETKIIARGCHLSTTGQLYFCLQSHTTAIENHTISQYDQVVALFLSGRTEDGLVACRDLLSDETLFSYYRIKVLALLAANTNDANEKRGQLSYPLHLYVYLLTLRLKACVAHAEHIYISIHDRWFPTEDAMTDHALAELRLLLDNLQQGQSQGAPLNYEQALASAFAETDIQDPLEESEPQRDDLADYDYEERHATVGEQSTNVPVPTSSSTWTGVQDRDDGSQQLEPPNCKSLAASCHKGCLLKDRSRKA